jgi:hypothetical protein
MLLLVLTSMRFPECQFRLSCFFPNGNATASCGVQVPQVLWPLPPVNPACTPHLWDKRFVVGGRCIPIGDGFLQRPR